LENKEDSFVKKLVIEGFDSYFKTYIIPLKEQYPNVPLHMIGTIAAGFQEYLHQAAQNNSLKVSSVIKEPIYNLLKYYLNEN
jgi:hypothetical protein